MESIEEANAPTNPLDPTAESKPGLHANGLENSVHPQAEPLPLDSAVTKAEKVERHEVEEETGPAKRRRIDSGTQDESNDTSPKDASNSAAPPDRPVVREWRKGEAPVKAEFLIDVASLKPGSSLGVVNDDAAEGAPHEPSGNAKGKKDKRKNKSQGMNTNRDFGVSKDKVGLCSSRRNHPEFSPMECKFGKSCKFEHDIRRYLKEHKREDLTTFGAVCPVWGAYGACDYGWSCRFVGSHSRERETEDGRKELILIAGNEVFQPGKSRQGMVNEISTQAKIDLTKRKFLTEKADEYTQWIDESTKRTEGKAHEKAAVRNGDDGDTQIDTEPPREGFPTEDKKGGIEDRRAAFIEPPFLPSEKKRIYFGPETPVLAPLTTTGNLPFRRLCVDQGAQLTYSEMAVSLPLIQGQKSEWALMRAHSSEAKPPAYKPTDKYLSMSNSVSNPYSNANDLKFGAQIAANKPWLALKTAETLTAHCPHLRLIDLNCGCPIDLIYRQGAGSALLDTPSKLEKILRGMNTVSGPVPITCKIRTGTKDSHPTALKLISRLVHGGHVDNLINQDLGGTGVAAITLHGRSRQQRYTKSADWSYIAECSSLIKSFTEDSSDLVDTARAPDPRTYGATAGKDAYGTPFFLGNGDVYSPEDYQQHITEAGVDSVMIGRGALIKPWVFEEIAAGQLLDKTASQRLSLVEQFCKYGLETWGSDEQGVGLTRRFLLEWLSFTCRYVPVGILEYLPPRIQDRPPAWRGRDEMETLLASSDYRDWVKISEMFLGKAADGFKFLPKHKSNSYEIEAEG